MRRLTPVAAWEARSGTATRAVDARVVALLRAVAASGTLAAAARSCSVPYRTAWGVIEDAGAALGAPLVVLERGRGATLTPLAQRWLALDDGVRAALDQPTFVLDVRGTTSRTAAAARGSPLRIAASHDLALAELKDRWSASHGIALRFQGSAESLDALLRGRADVAGFHVDVRRHEGDPLLARLDASRDALLRFITRTQGLMLPRGNPRRVKALADVATKGLSFVNRQPGSGTRLLLDRLLAESGVAAEAIAGYGREEFTHAAVAATVASGRAEAAFGIQAAAAQFGLAFVPVATERYLFACRRRALDTPRMAAFRALLASPATGAVVRPLPGYALDSPGTLLR
jgi:molybdate transport repressor ModE-like protein